MSTQVNNHKALAEAKRMVGDTEYTLRYAMRAMAAIQDHFGEKSLTAAVARMREIANLGVEDLVAILHAGLVSRHKGITKDQAMDIADEMSMEDLQQWITDAFLAASSQRPETGGEEGRGGGTDPQ